MAGRGQKEGSNARKADSSGATLTGGVLVCQLAAALVRFDAECAGLP